ncbi:pullulanase-type alpha-1,6-glucosidase [Planosporangium thailandense]|uniref:Alpha-amylase n=2 Tax=Planosporangium thailandense TaxID=765197 RepID=A0ABX0XWV4_9ACTN|nr:pullulanase-type alpha-1,6-glucosidase [Planosporangium thailandense]
MTATASAAVVNLPERPVSASGTISGAPTWDREPSAASLADAADGSRSHAEQFYFALPDRFANGDTANDRGGLTGDRLATGYDPTDKGFYHGGDLKGVTDKLDYIKGLGTTAIWLAPIFKNKPVQANGSDVSAGYHGYWITDFTRVDPHFGTEADLDNLVKAAHRKGMKVYLDIITNHTADVIRSGSEYVGKADAPYKDASGHPFDDANYADGTHGFPKVNVNSFPYQPTFPTPADATVKKPAWLNDPTMYHNRGNSTYAGENATYGDFVGLDDLWTERPDVVRGMTDIYASWIGRAGIDGYRIDTVKNVDLPFWPQFAAGVEQAARKAGKPNFFMFGEVYSGDPEVDSTYVRQGRLPATLDFPFQAAASDYAARGGSAGELAALYASDDLYTTSGTDARRLPTFLGNHDMGRIGSFVRAAGGDATTQLDKDILAHQLMFLTRGQPIVYSGDEQGFTGPGGDKDARQDMFGSLVPSYLTDPLLGTDRTHAVDQYDPNHPLYRTIAQLGALRQANPALRDGVQVTRYAADGPGVFAFSRIDPAQRVEYVVAVNNATTAQTATFGTYGGSFASIYPSTGRSVASAKDGKLTVTVPPLSAVVYKARKALPKPSGAPKITITTPAAGQKVPTRTRVVADVAGDPLASVSVAVQVGNGPWQLLGTATHAPYAVYHDLTGLEGNTRLRYKAVVRDGAGHTATATTTAYVGTPPAATDRDYLVVHYQRPAGDYAPWGLYVWGDVDPSSVTTWPAGQPFTGEDAYGRFAWVKLKPGARNVGFLVVDANGVKDVASDRSVDPSQTGEIWLRQGDATVYPSDAAATKTVAVHYNRPDGAYTGWSLSVSGADRQPDGTDSYGVYWNVPVGDPTKPVTFTVHNGATNDPGADRSVLPAAAGDAWVRSGDQTVYPNRAAAEHSAVLHYRRPAGDYTGWGMHVWAGAAKPTDWGAPLPPAGQDAYGDVFRVPLADGAKSLSYIIHDGDSKDLPADQSLDLVKTGNEVWLLAAQPRYLLPMAAPSAPDTDITKAKAQWIDRDTVLWKPGPTDGRTFDLRAGGQTIRLHAGVLTEAQRQKYPNLWDYQAFTVDPADRGKVRDALRGQVVAYERDADGKVLAATGVQLPGVLDDLYAAATRATLGPVFAGNRVTLSVWAPTAQTVSLELADAPTASPTLVPMRRDDTTGVWSASGAWKGRYYRYRVTAWQPAAQKVVTASVTDPYSVDLSVDSTFSRATDLNDRSLAPAGWSGLRKPGVDPSKIQIQELSVRDFSSSDDSVPAAHRGTYLAFTDANSAGMTHLRDQAKAGLTHVHLLPVFDFASVPERRADQQTPACDLAKMAPDSDQQQACIAAVANSDGYNWGYDPLHYTAPEGSYAVDPDRRITEFRQMVAGLNNAGLRVVMDVVYNHTDAAGTDKFSVLDQIVPGYYQRLLDDGTVANSTCCANTAPEHAMMGKLVVDSVVTWARQYKVDGFRFDLMGHHPKDNILAVRAALDKLTLARDGVDGKKIYVYGEGWNFGEVADNARFTQATQANLAGTGIGTFNDRLRDAVRGGGPFDADPRIQGFASGLYTDPNGDPVNGSTADQKARLLHYQDLIKVGLTGNLAGYRFVDSSGKEVTGAQVDYNGAPAGYTASPREAITYVDAHDNEILYDALAYKLPQRTSATDRARMQVLALSTTILGQGVGFSAAGSDRLRSKSLDGNSFNSGDWFNAMSWDCHAGNGFGRGLPQAADNKGKWPYAKPLLADPKLVPDCAAVDATSNGYADLLRIRDSSPAFGFATAADVQRHVSFPLSGAGETPGVITMTVTGDPHWKSITVVFNATPGTVTQTLAGLRGATVALHPIQAAGSDPVVKQSGFDAATGALTVPGRTVAVFVQS